MIQALREEVTQYGELLALLEKQQQLILGRSTDGLLGNLRSIHAQVPLVGSARQCRDDCRQALASALGQPATISFRILIAAAPPHCRALFEALVDEINDLLQRSQERLRQNHRLISRSLSSLHRMILELLPSPEQETLCR